MISDITISKRKKIMENFILITIFITVVIYLFNKIKKNLVDGEPGENCAHCGKLQLKKHFAMQKK